MTTAADPPVATLIVTVDFGRPELSSTAVPVRVCRPSMAIVAHGLTGEPIPVPAGSYVVTTTLPGGEELFEQTEVATGATRTVELSPSAAAAAPTTSARHAMQQYFTAEPDVTIGIRAGTRRGVAAPRTPERTVYLRLLAGNPLRPPLRTVGAARVRFPGRGGAVREPLGDLPALPSPAYVAPPASGADVWHGPDRCQLQVQMPASTDDEQVFWLRVTAPPDRARFVAVPALAGHTCSLLLARPGRNTGGFTVDLHLADPQYDALMQYRQSGDAAQARAVLGRLLLDRSAASPLYRALVGYAALRLGVEQLASGDVGQVFERAGSPLPDAWVVEAEFRARRGEHDLAQELFVEATRHGLPLFGDGLGHLSTRIPQFVRLAAAAGETASRVHERLTASWAGLLPFVNAADLKAATLTVRGGLIRFSDR